MHTAIIGAGISGLTLAHALVRKQQRVTIFEAAAQAGGSIATEHRNGFTLERGPHTLVDREPRARELIEQLGLTPCIQPADARARQRFVAIEGQLIPVSPSLPQLLKSGLFSPGGLARALLEPLFARRALGGDESLAQFTRRHFGEAAVPLVDAMQTGVFAGDVETLSAAAAFPVLKTLEQSHRSVLVGMARTAKRGAPALRPYTFEGGLAVLVRALVDALTVGQPDALRLNTKVKQLTRSAVTDTPWHLTLDNGETVTADRVIVALPSWRAAELLQPLNADLAAALTAIRHVNMIEVHLAFADGADDAAHPSPSGFGFVVPGKEARPVIGTIFTSALFPSHAPKGQQLYTCMMGGAHRPELVSLDDAAIEKLAREALQETLGLTAAPTLASIIRWPRGIPQYDVGHRMRIASIRATEATLAGLHLIGNAYDGVGVNDCIRGAVNLAERLS